MPSLLSRLAPKPFRESVHVALHKMAGLWFDSACRGGRRLRSRVCPVEEKAKIEICESDQRVADFNSANVGLDAAFASADRLEAEAARARALLDRLEAAILA